ncbi:hypothetical protein EON65_37435, partial [archaeon]
MTQLHWTSPSSSFQSLVEDPSSLRIIQNIVTHLPAPDLNCMHLQALCRGFIVRVSRFSRLNLIARLGVILTSDIPVEMQYPVLIKIKANRYGVIKRLLLYDVRTDRKKYLVLKSPFGPLNNMSLHDLKLTIRVSKVHNNDKSTLHYVISDKPDHDNGSMFSEIDSHVQLPIQHQNRFELVMKYTDTVTLQYVYKKVLLFFNQLNDQMFPVLDYEDLLATQGVTRQNSYLIEDNNAPANLQALSNLNEEDGGVELGTKSNDILDTSSLPGSESNHVEPIVSMDYNSSNNVHTSIITKSLLKRGFLYNNYHYLVHIMNDKDVTQVTFFQVQTSKLFIFLTLREHVPLQHTFLNQQFEMLLNIVYIHPVLQFMIDEHTPKHALDDVSSISNSFTILENTSQPAPPLQPILEMSSSPPDLSARTDPSEVMNEEYLFSIQNHLTNRSLSCHARLLPDSQGVTVILIDPLNLPIVGSAFEILEEAMENNLSSAEGQKVEVALGEGLGGRKSSVILSTDALGNILEDQQELVYEDEDFYDDDFYPASTTPSLPVTHRSTHIAPTP